MRHEDFEQVLEVIAKQNGISREQVRSEMQQAMEEGMQSTDPLVQKRWKLIPRKNNEPTLEEFVEYLLRFV